MAAILIGGRVAGLQANRFVVVCQSRGEFSGSAVGVAAPGEIGRARGGELDRPIVMRNGSGPVLLRIGDVAEDNMSLGNIRIEPQAVCAILSGLGVVLELVVGIRTIAEKGGLAGLEIDGAIVIFDGGEPIVLGIVEVGLRVERVGALGIELECLVQVAPRLVVFAEKKRLIRLKRTLSGVARKSSA
jgi:hypothetical protein